MNPFSSRYKKASGGMWPEVRVLTKYNGLEYVNPWMRPFVSTDLVLAKHGPSKKRGRSAKRDVLARGCPHMR